MLLPWLRQSLVCIVQSLVLYVVFCGPLLVV
jgi:hypothetical protein